MHQRNTTPSFVPDKANLPYFTNYSMSLLINGFDASIHSERPGNIFDEMMRAECLR